MRTKFRDMERIYSSEYNNEALKTLLFEILEKILPKYTFGRSLRFDNSSENGGDLQNKFLTELLTCY